MFSFTLQLLWILTKSPFKENVISIQVLKAYGEVEV